MDVIATNLSHPVLHTEINESFPSIEGEKEEQNDESVLFDQPYNPDDDPFLM